MFPKFPCYTFAAMNAEKEFIEKVTRLFMRLGIKSLTMDEIARQLGVSKKTIYKYVADKNELVRRAVAFQQEEEQAAIQAICSKGHNAIDELFEISRHISDMLAQIHPSVHFDLEKYHPDAWKLSMSCRQQQVYECIFGNLENGKKQGFYRADLDSDIIAKIYIAKLDVVFDGELFPVDQYKFATVYLEFFRYHIRGIASEKGLNYLIEKVKKERSNQ